MYLLKFSYHEGGVDADGFTLVKDLDWGDTKEKLAIHNASIPLDHCEIEFELANGQDALAHIEATYIPGESADDHTGSMDIFYITKHFEGEFGFFPNSIFDL